MYYLKVLLPLLLLMAVPIPLLIAQARVNRPVAKATVKMSGQQARALHSLNESGSNLERLNKIHAETLETNRQLLALYTVLQKKLDNLEKLAARPGTTREQLADAIRQAAQVQEGADITSMKLQSRLSNLSSSYTAASNMMKAEHDTMKNIISNMR